MTKEKSKTGVGKGILYLLVGGGIGAILALLFAPKTGKEMRGEIGGAAQKGWDKTGEFAANIGDKAQTVYQDTKTKAGEFYDTAKQKLNSATASITETVGEDAKAVELEGEQILSSVIEAVKPPFESENKPDGEDKSFKHTNAA
ncbi:hypothetical protein BH10ACI1_BH10ACI1_25960 [soil metagenome]